MIALPLVPLIHLGADSTAEVYPPTDCWPVCLRLDDGEGHVSIDLSAATWAKLKAAVEAALAEER